MGAFLDLLVGWRHGSLLTGWVCVNLSADSFDFGRFHFDCQSIDVANDPRAFGCYLSLEVALAASISFSFICGLLSFRLQNLRLLCGRATVLSRRLSFSETVRLHPSSGSFLAR